MGSAPTIQAHKALDSISGVAREVVEPAFAVLLGFVSTALVDSHVGRRSVSFTGLLQFLSRCRMNYRYIIA